MNEECYDALGECMNFNGVLKPLGRETMDMCEDARWAIDHHLVYQEVLLLNGLEIPHQIRHEEISPMQTRITYPL